MIKIFINSITIVFIEIGIFAWYQLADFNEKLWVDRYYVWDKIINVLLVFCIVKPSKTLMPFWVLIGLFFVIRCLLEITLLHHSMWRVGVFLTNYKIMFLINLLCILSVFIMQKRKCQK